MADEQPPVPPAAPLLQPNPAADEDSDFEDQEAAQPPRPTQPEYEPSMNRGPGTIEDRGDAKTLRQKTSQHETVAKKRKIGMETGINTGKAYVNVAQVIGGEGAIFAGYLQGRHNHSKKGTPIGPSTEFVLNKIYSKAGAKYLEMSAVDAQPKFAVGQGQPVGRNLSPALKPVEAAKLGFKFALRGPLDHERGLRLATHGVNMYNMFEAELQNQNPAGPPPTRDEVIAAIQLSLLEAPENRNKPLAERTPVNDN